MKKELNNFRYEFISSSLDGHHEICASFKYKEKAVKYFIFVKDKEKANNSYYLDEAKRRIARDTENGKLVKYAKHYGKNNDHEKGVLVFLIVLFGIAALTLAGLFTYNYLKSNGIIKSTYTTTNTYTLPK